MKKSKVAIAIGSGIGAIIAAKMLTRPRTVDWASVAEEVPHSDRSKFTNIDGSKIHYQEFGSRQNPSLILVHGYTASLYVWHKLAPLLADSGFHVVAVDLVGFGYSEKPRAFDYSIQSQARMLARFMNRLGIGKATLIGSSYGGAVSMTVALDYSEYVDRLILLDPVCNDEVKSHPILRIADIPLVGEIIAPFLVDSRALARHRMRNTLSKSNRHLITRERIKSVRRPLAASDGHHSVLATSRNWRANRIQEDAHLITQQTLIIWGEEDTVIGIHNGYKLHESMLNSRFVVLRNCGHVPAEEKSDLVSDLIDDFLNSPKGHVELQSDEARLED